MNETEEFLKEFPGLKGKEIHEFRNPMEEDFDRYNCIILPKWAWISYNKDNIQKHCLDKKRVLKVLNDLQETIGKRGTNLVIYDLIKRKKKELKL